MFGDLEILIRGRTPLIFIDTIEIMRAIENIKMVYNNLVNKFDELSSMNFYIYSARNGMEGFSSELDIANIITTIACEPNDITGLFIIPVTKDIFDGYSLSVITNILVLYRNRLIDEGRYIIFVGDISIFPEEIKILGSHMELNRPTEDEIIKFLSDMIPIWIGAVGKKIKKNNIKKIARTVAGLTLPEIEMTVKNMFIKTNTASRRIAIDYDILLKEKANLVKKTGLLEMVEARENIDNVGGLSHLKMWAKTIKYIYDNIEEAKKFGLKPPKGCLITGISGCGKSLFAKAIATYIGLPIFRLDVGRLYNSLVGETERNTRELFKIIDSVSPCVVLIDEIEKMFAGMQSSGRTDSGVTARLLGNMLYYMEERRNNALFIATANDISGMPPEMLRKGRWDELWFVDIPNEKERLEILKIHIEKSGRKFENVFKNQKEVKEFIRKSVKFTGAEIEQVVEDALRTAFINKRELTAKDIVTSCNTVRPLVDTMKHAYSAIRNWASNNCRTANS